MCHGSEIDHPTESDEERNSIDKENVYRECHLLVQLTYCFWDVNGVSNDQLSLFPDYFSF